MNNMIEYKIIWEKWNDPFGENVDELKWNKYDDDEELEVELSGVVYTPILGSQ